MKQIHQNILRALVYCKVNIKFWIAVQKCISCEFKVNSPKKMKTVSN